MVTYLEGQFEAAVKRNDFLVPYILIIPIELPKRCTSYKQFKQIPQNTTQKFCSYLKH